MNKILNILLPLAVFVTACSSEKPVVPIKDQFADQFLVGAAIPTTQLRGLDPKADSLVVRHYNSIVGENCMKSEKINPEEGVYFWDDADALVEFGERHGMAVIGHALVWHSQLAPWFLVDSTGNYVSAEVLKERMRRHIHTLVGRYKGRVKGWDVVNEAIMEDGSYRHSPFYEILGEEFIPLAFQYAHEADPDVELYINDYSMAKPAKRQRYLELVDSLRARGLRIDGIGLQGHMGMDYPPLDEFEKSIEAFGNTGLQVMITEWDVSAIPTVHEGADIGEILANREQYDPYKKSLPDTAAQAWGKRVAECVEIFRRHSDVISRVTLWGTHDGMSWRNNFPMFGRTDYPLPFDRQYKLKPAFADAIAPQD